MVPYYFLFAGLVLASLVSQDRKVYSEIGAQGLFFILLAMTLLLGLRHGVGSDFHSYERIFYGVGDLNRLGPFIYRLSESTPIESGFALLMLSVKVVANSYTLFVFVLSIISIALKYAIFKKLSPFLAVSFLIYFSDEWFWKDLSGARVALASTFILFGAYYAYCRRIFLFFGFVFLAILFHSASIIALPIYFIRGILQSRMFLFLSLLASLALAAFGGVGLLISEVATAFGTDESSRLVKYANSKYVDGISAFGGTFMIHLALSLLMIYFYKPLVYKWSYNSILIPMYIYGTVLMFSLIDYGIVAGRIREMLCVPALVIVLPSFILLFRGNQRIVPYFAIVAYCGLWFYMMTLDRAPYQSILHFIS
ncbi:EpsG family protein [Natronospirillum operosum]|uniref:EpsG family protein n=1 Tax=Natronospirillum operosum TaxID=2759953 RepID=A0A4Z0WHJ4_9GAMM|nr:EpsG family protein [Natronospirillum operosum]TGG95256.1 EpsG family protein [Natronospirillum operosum]